MKEFGIPLMIILLIVLGTGLFVSGSTGALSFRHQNEIGIVQCYSDFDFVCTQCCPGQLIEDKCRIKTTNYELPRKINDYHKCVHDFDKQVKYAIAVSELK